MSGPATVEQTLSTQNVKTHQKNWNGVSLDNMSLLKGHCLHKGYVQMPVLKVHNYIPQSAIAHLGNMTHGMSRECCSGLLGKRNIVGPHAIAKPSPSEVCQARVEIQTKC